MALVLRYAGFALAATLLNLALQRSVIAALGAERGLLPALLVGTLGGLALKYLLDKRWIFDDRTTGRQVGHQFGLYSLMGVATTMLFWASESLFWLVGQSQEWREAGAILGLAVGYSAKYFLDQRFVFTSSDEVAA